MKIEAILFDKDGTLFDFQATWSDPFRAFLERVAPEGGRKPTAEALGYDLANGAFRPDSVVIAGTTDDVARVLSPVTGRGAAEIIRMLDEAGSAARQKPAVPLRPCLTSLKTTYRLGLVTNDSEAPARAHLAQEDILDLFEFVAGYDSGFGAKPEPGQLLAFADRTGIAPAATLMVGDSRHDLHAARAAGMVPVAVLTGVARADDLADLAHVILPDIGHLERWLETSVP